MHTCTSASNMCRKTGKEQDEGMEEMRAFTARVHHNKQQHGACTHARAKSRMYPKLLLVLLTAAMPLTHVVSFAAMPAATRTLRSLNNTGFADASPQILLWLALALLTEQGMGTACASRWLMAHAANWWFIGFSPSPSGNEASASLVW